MLQASIIFTNQNAWIQDRPRRPGGTSTRQQFAGQLRGVLASSNPSQVRSTPLRRHWTSRHPGDNASWLSIDAAYSGDLIGIRITLSGQTRFICWHLLISGSPDASPHLTANNYRDSFTTTRQSINIAFVPLSQLQNIERPETEHRGPSIAVCLFDSTTQQRRPSWPPP